MSEIRKRVQGTLQKFEEGTLQSEEGGWRLSFEWEALQPQRTRIIKPVLYLYSPEPAQLSIRARVFADSFPEPFLLEAKVSLATTQSSISLTNLVPDWSRILKEAE